MIFLSILPLYVGLNHSSSYLFSSLGIVLINLLTVSVLIYTTYWAFNNRRESWIPWLFILLGQLIYATAEMAYLILAIYPNMPLLYITDDLFMINYPFFIAGFFMFIKRPFKLKTKNLIDIIILMLAAFFLIWFLLIEPSLQSHSLSASIERILYLFMDILILFSILTLLINRSQKISELTIVLFFGTVVSQIVGDVLFSYNVVDPNSVYTWVSCVLYMITSSFTFLAGISFIKNVNFDSKPIQSLNKFLETSNWVSYIPFITVLVTYSILLLLKTPSQVLIMCVGILVALVVIRELISLDELKKTQKDLEKSKELIEESEAQLRFISSNMMDLVTESNNEFEYKFVSNSSQPFLGYTAQDMLGNDFFDYIHPDDVDKVKETVERAIENRSSARVECRYKKADGENVWVETIKKPIFNENEFKGFICSSRDISPQKENERIINDSLHEKEVLLREIHHRVKNNLQIISSLLNLQSHYIEDEETLDVLMESKNRIKTMAIVHEELYRSPNLTNINFKEYLERLLSNLFYSYGINGEIIEPKFDLEESNISIDTAIPCGLIINELVTNSLKYAFPKGRKGKIEVSLKSNGGAYILKIADNGTGLPEGIEPENAETLGLQLVNSLVRQIEGSMELIRNNGTEFKISFSEMEYEKRV
ncbi:histidine kinase dimerization/phosphoacceptor domain -containing protein [Methanobacterium aggregans]|uniref:histidine kinase dimerization/phosphoacceptor domain -containing protein n=2 Tax=Methanobacterium aggregans TaxID=1615586 RepID=UPI00321125E6